MKSELCSVLPLSPPPSPPQKPAPSQKFSVSRVFLNKPKIENLEDGKYFHLRINSETGFLEFWDFNNKIKFMSKLSKSFLKEKII